MSSAVGATQATSPDTSQQAASTKSKSTLGKDDFLKLLMVQMQYQDPLKPMDNTAFVAQMAQFSSLEQMQNVANSSRMTQATGYIGKAIVWTDSTGASQSGAVSAVNVVNGEPQLVVGNSTVDLDKVTAVGGSSSETASASSAIASLALSLIGKNITWKDSSGNSQSGVVTSATFENDVPQLYVGTTEVDFSSVSKVGN
ncbi:flagellar basal-body rod modification protein FlgD [Sporomusaceae bacterium BoRhaA]|uniref:flagellar hook capping FlgD N-terminal domain-containing protein n=1 Tax=Pelorhabdus rhamnosifermentans TaxID=2772457 RepID=UPI001C062CAA|nr:flagellar hook capping FlgD N-terminal domain-containing protein [Pelorhabdus rhamnosifermentans]MBU2702008.1 flagellar basal-body rod modification protein FlgD [Pelorhabdus rhamnosifermentans]